MIFIRRGALGLLTCLLLVAGLSGSVKADKKKAEPTGPKFEQTGPATVKLGSDLATLKLPKGFGFIGAAATREMLEKAGGGGGQGVLGFIGSTEGQDYGIILSFEERGYVEDKDADQLKGDEILKSLTEGTEEQNEERKKRGIPELHVVGWDEAPHYEKARHVVLWSIKGQIQGQADPIVNYNTRVLGRKGILAVNLICDQKNLAKYKPEVGKVLEGLAYNQGQRYEDYQSGDKVSAGGIAALIVGGVVLKKAGILAFFLSLFKPILALGGKLLALGGKAIVFLLAGVVGIVKTVMGRKKAETPQPETPQE